MIEKLDVWIPLAGTPASWSAATRAAPATVAYIATAGLLIVMAVVSLLTAGRNTFIVYRLCAPIFTTSAILLLAAAAT